MRYPESVFLISLAAVPSLALAASAFIWIAWRKTLTPLPEAAFGLGLALLALVILACAFSAFPNLSTYADSPVFLLAVPFVVYAASFAMATRKTRVHFALVFSTAIAGLVPLYYLGGAALMLTVCGFNSGGC
jgi:hypothetical protein